MKRLEIFLFTALIMFVASSCKQPPLAPYVTGLENRPLPAFNILLQDSATYLNTEKIKAGKGVILFYYSSTCQFCRAQMREMLNDIDHYNDKLLLVITNGNFESMKSYIQYFKLNKYKNVISGLDVNNAIEPTFRVGAVPFTAVFSKEKKLTAAYIGRLKGAALRTATY